MIHESALSDILQVRDRPKSELNIDVTLSTYNLIWSRNMDEDQKWKKRMCLGVNFSLENRFNGLSVVLF